MDKIHIYIIGQAAHPSISSTWSCHGKSSCIVRAFESRERHYRLRVYAAYKWIEVAVYGWSRGRPDKAANGRGDGFPQLTSPRFLAPFASAQQLAPTAQSFSIASSQEHEQYR